MDKKILLRVGLAFTLLFAGIDSFLNTKDWLWFVPTWVEKFGITTELALHAHAAVEIILGLLLLSGWKLRWAAAIVAMDMLVIIFANGWSRALFLTTFRDVGLFFTAVYLAVEKEKQDYYLR